MRTRLYAGALLPALVLTAPWAEAAAPPATGPRAVTRHEVTVRGTGFLLNGDPFPYTGVSFFNALYNPAFNKSSADRQAWVKKFKRYGVNVLRVWAQWDNKRGFVDAGKDATLYHPDGRLKKEYVERLKQILLDCDRHGVVVQLVFFAQESRRDGVVLKPEAADRAVAALTRELLPYRNVTFQIWNEFSERVPEQVKLIKGIDARRLVTNSPGFSGVLGDPKENALLDYLTPHTSRQGAGKHWEIAPAEVAYLLKRFRKPVVDDEPARNGTSKFGGPRDATRPLDHVVHILGVWKAGGHPTYHHDMFQTGYGSAAVPKSGIPDPEFSPYHRQVFEFLALRERYRPAGR